MPLLDKGYQNIWVLDISEFAFERAKRLGDKVHLVHWVVSDITTIQTEVKFDFGNDRACFTSSQKKKVSINIAIIGNATNKKRKFSVRYFSENGP
jgi:hypothetical protein